MSEQIAFSYDGLNKAIEDGIEQYKIDREALVFGIQLPDGERVPVDTIEFVICASGTPALLFGFSEEPEDGEKEDIPFLKIA